VTGDRLTTPPSDPAECQVVIGTGELIESVEVIDASGDLTNPFGVAAISPAPTATGVPALFVADPSARVILVLDHTGTALSSFSSDVFDGDFGAASVAWVASSTPGADASLFAIGGAPGEPFEIREFAVSATGSATLQSFHVTQVVDAVTQTAFIGTPGGLAAQRTADGLDTVLCAVQPEGCVIFCLLGSSPNGFTLPALTFPHPDPGAQAFGLNGIAIAGGPGSIDASGGTLLITGQGSAPGQFAMSEVEVAPGSVVPTGETVPFSALAAENILGDFDLVTDPAGQSLGVRVIGVTRSTVNKVEASSYAAYIAGDVNGDGQVNIGDAITALGILFTGTPQLQCDAAVDANGDSSLNIADAIYILTYLFMQGPAPVRGASVDPFECL
jgi:hypothetical protein